MCNLLESEWTTTAFVASFFVQSLSTSEEKLERREREAELSWGPLLGWDGLQYEIGDWRFLFGLHELSLIPSKWRWAEKPTKVDLMTQKG